MSARLPWRRPSLRSCHSRCALRRSSSDIGGGSLQARSSETGAWGERQFWLSRASVPWSCFDQRVPWEGRVVAPAAVCPKSLLAVMRPDQRANLIVVDGRYESPPPARALPCRTSRMAAISTPSPLHAPPSSPCAPPPSELHDVSPESDARRLRRVPLADHVPIVPRRLPHAHGPRLLDPVQQFNVVLPQPPLCHRIPRGDPSAALCAQECAGAGRSLCAHKRGCSCVLIGRYRCAWHQGMSGWDVCGIMCARAPEALEPQARRKIVPSGRVGATLARVPSE